MSNVVLKAVQKCIQHGDHKMTFPISNCFFYMLFLVLVNAHLSCHANTNVTSNFLTLGPVQELTSVMQVSLFTLFIIDCYVFTLRINTT